MGYWRYLSSKPKLTTPQIEEQPIEVPKTLPQANLDDKVKSLEDLAAKLATQVNNLKSSSPQPSLTSNTKDIEAQITELKARVSALEKATPAPASTTSSVSYIPLGSGGGPWADKGWYSIPYEVSINTDNYPNYSGMNLEVTFRMNQKAGTGSVRLYNVTDSTGYAQVDTTSDVLSLKTSSSFKIASGTKTYTLQIKSSEGADLYIQSARIKVNF